METLVEKVEEEYKQFRPSLEVLIHKIFESKKLQVELTEDLEPLVSIGLLRRDISTFEIQCNLLLGLTFLNYFKELFFYEITKNFEDAEDFIYKIEKFFNEKNIFGSWAIEDQISAYILLYQSEILKNDPTDFILSKTRETKGNIFELNRVVNSMLPFLNIGIENIYKIINHLLKEIKGDLTIDENFTGIRSFVNDNYLKADELLNFVINNPQGTEEGFLSTVLTSLYNKFQDKKYFKICLTLLGTELETEAMSALVEFNYETEKDFKIAFNSITLIDNVKEDSELRQVRFYLKAYTNPFSNESLISTSSQKLESLLKSDSYRIHNVFVNNCHFLNTFPNEKFRFLTLINTLHIDSFDFNRQLRSFEEPKHLFNYLRIFINGQSIINFNIKYFEPSILYFESKPNFSDELINFLIEEDGKFRWFGNKMLHYLSQVKHTPFIFKNNVLNLSIDNQHRLAASVLIHTHQPEESIPSILPLARSKNNFIRNFIRFKLEELVYVYSKSITDILNQYLDNSKEQDVELKQHIQSKYEEFCQMFDKKNKINEFNPYLTQEIIFEKFRKIFQKHSSESLSQATENDKGFLSIIPKVIIGRGKGWKLSNSNRKSKLTKFSTSYLLPRDYFISPDVYDYLTKLEILEKWRKNNTNEQGK